MYSFKNIFKKSEKLLVGNFTIKLPDVSHIFIKYELYENSKGIRYIKIVNNGRGYIESHGLVYDILYEWKKYKSNVFNFPTYDDINSGVPVRNH